jgi:hypothetical protein
VVQVRLCSSMVSVGICGTRLTLIFSGSGKIRPRSSRSRHGAWSAPFQPPICFAYLGLFAGGT